MSEEQYLPVKEGLGYRNLKIALMNVFSIDLDKFTIIEGEFENFGFHLNYNNKEIIIWITSTGKNRQFEYGEGGQLMISLPNPKYPDRSFLDRVTLESLLTDTEKIEAVDYAFGRYEHRLEIALAILKDYLDSDEAKVLLKNE
ncbi:TPA: hypothetical protein SUC28_001332 [Streptococcus equi subsp. equi]|nr:hypothetical protein [Streptococcus equi subsp. equi]